MSLRQSYTKEFKESVVKKLLNRDSETINQVCEREGVLPSSAKNWLKVCGKLGTFPTRSRRGRMQWNPEAKLRAVIDTSSLQENELGKYLRSEGLYSNQIVEWRAEIIENLSLKSTFKKDERDERIRVLEREILRKDKALAEASALLILQKKASLIWGTKDEDEK